MESVSGLNTSADTTIGIISRLSQSLFSRVNRHVLGKRLAFSYFQKACDRFYPCVAIEAYCLQVIFHLISPPTFSLFCSPSQVKCTLIGLLRILIKVRYIELVPLYLFIGFGIFRDDSSFNWIICAVCFFVLLV